jgi:hypothetical protein
MLYERIASLGAGISPVAFGRMSFLPYVVHPGICLNGNCSSARQAYPLVWVWPMEDGSPVMHTRKIEVVLRKKGNEIEDERCTNRTY